MKKSLIILFVLCSFHFSEAQKKDPVFVSGQEGYKSFRIPAIIEAPNGDLLAFCEGRVNNAGDFGHVNIVMKRSSDKGKTWSRLQVVSENGNLQAGNAAPVVDMDDPDFPHGRIFLFYNTGNAPEGEVRKGNGVREVWYKTSTNNGNTWSDPANITSQVKKSDWRAYANTPGHAMQFQSGKYEGRIFVAANHSVGNPQPEFTDYDAHGFYTDDHGKTFHYGASINMPGSNESTATELSGGRLMMNSRNQRGNIRARIVSISSNGGETWDTSYFGKKLIDPVNEGSLLTIGNRNGKNILAFCNDADTHHRDNLTLRISFDDGKTWKKTFVLAKSPEGYKGDFTAYSDLVKLGKNKVGILYERDNYREIVFTAVNWQR